MSSEIMFKLEIDLVGIDVNEVKHGTYISGLIFLEELIYYS